MKQLKHLDKAMMRIMGKSAVPLIGMMLMSTTALVVQAGEFPGPDPMPVVDTNPPLCECLEDDGSGGGEESLAAADREESPAYNCFGQADDSRPSEDINGNGVLDPGEDLNGNGMIDEDTGIFSLSLSDGSVNLALSPDPFVPGDGTVGFFLEMLDTDLPAIGEVVATDGAGNSCQLPQQLGNFDPYGGLILTPRRNIRLFLNRPSPGTDAARCVETEIPGTPDYSGLNFDPFTSENLELDFLLSEGNGSKEVCCQYRSDSGAVSPSVCASIELEEENMPPNSPPDCSNATASPSLWPPNHKLMAETGVTGVIDPDGDAVSIAILTVTQDEPVLVRGSGKTCPDAVIQGETALIRAERSGLHDGRVYRIGFEASDPTGARCTGEVNVCVPHDQSGTDCVEGPDVHDSTTCPTGQ